MNTSVYVMLGTLFGTIGLVSTVIVRGVRSSGPLMIDGQRCQERGLLRPTSSVSGEDFCFAVEPLGTRMVTGV